MAEPMSTDGEQRHEGRDRRRDTRLVATGVVAVLLLWFALDNLQSVKIQFWVHTTRAPLIVVVAIAVALGAAVVLLVSRFTKKRPPTDHRAVGVGAGLADGGGGRRPRQGSASSSWEATRHQERVLPGAGDQLDADRDRPLAAGGNGLVEREADRGLAAHVERGGEGAHRQHVRRGSRRACRVGLLEDRARHRGQDRPWSG